MKKFLFVLFLLIPISALAASSVTETVTQGSEVDGKRLFKVELAWTDNATASFTDYVITSDVAGYIVRGVLDPGTPSPTASYDVLINDSNGVDVFGAQLIDGSATASSQAMPKIGSGYGSVRVVPPLTLDINNQAVNSAQGKVILYIER